jgi:hypothetical protein
MLFGTPRFGRISDTELRTTLPAKTLAEQAANHSRLWSQNLPLATMQHWGQDASILLKKMSERIQQLEAEAKK